MNEWWVNLQSEENGNLNLCLSARRKEAKQKAKTEKTEEFQEPVYQ